MEIKIYNAVSGILKIIGSILVGLMLGCYAIYYLSTRVPLMDLTDWRQIFVLLLLVFYVSSNIGILICSISQFGSVFKPIQLNAAVVLCIDVLAIIFAFLAHNTVCIYFGEFGLIFERILLFLYWGLLVLITVDAIALCIKIGKEKTKVFNEANFLILLNGIKRTVIPLLLILFVLMIKSVITNNLELIEMNDGLSGGFDSFKMTDFDGNEYTEDMFVGHKVTMINAWGTFCRPCITEMPVLEEISRMYDENDLQLVGITSDLYDDGVINQDQIDLARDIIDKIGVEYTILIPSQEIQTGLISDIQLYPTTIFVNEKGEELKIVEGAKHKDEWIDIIEEVLASEK